jgi:hypothetical protein
MTQRAFMGCLIAVAALMALVIAILLLMLTGIVPIPFVQLSQ